MDAAQVEPARDAWKMKEEMERGLAGEKSSLPMIPTYLFDDGEISADVPVVDEHRKALLFLSELQDFIEKRYAERPAGSYTTELFESGLNRMAQKVGEEALEAVIEATNGTNERLVYEGSDLLYHLIVLLTSKGLRIEDLARELADRHDPNWRKH